MSLVGRIVAASIVGVVFLFAFDASAAPIVWNSGPGHNNHSYEVIQTSTPITWDEAQAAAILAGGYLATTLSAEENAFVFALADFSAYWAQETPTSSAHLGPWLGGYQLAGSAEPGGGWTWVNGDGPFSFTMWAGGEPSNGAGGPHGLTESRVHYFAYGGRGSTWNDFPETFTGGTPGYTFAGPIAYVVEYDRAVAPEPAIVLLLGSGVIARMLASRRRPIEGRN